MSQIDDKYLNLLRSRYRQASKKEKTAILDEYVKTTGQNRKYAIDVLRTIVMVNNTLNNQRIQV